MIEVNMLIDASHVPEASLDVRFAEAYFGKCGSFIPGVPGVWHKQTGRSSTTAAWNKRNRSPIPVVDIFAGPGGLGEGFARYPYQEPDSPKFQIRLSIEKEIRSHETLRLRSFTRQFPPQNIPDLYYQVLQQTERSLTERMHDLFEKYPRQAEAAEREAVCAELGNRKFKKVIENSLSQAVGDVKDWVLLGGPPCQAYSLVGRSRNRGKKDYRPEQDHRHFLYQEYLKVIATHLPAVFVMENVKGLLSATVSNKRIFEQIVRDLQNPRQSLGKTGRKSGGVKSSYRLYSLNDSSQLHMFGEHSNPDFKNFVIRMEDHGVPQARHRLIILGIREDLAVDRIPMALAPAESAPVSKVLGDLPRLRSGLSKQEDTCTEWLKQIARATRSPWYRNLGKEQSGLKLAIKKAVSEMKQADLDRGSEWIPHRAKPVYLKRWFSDRKMRGVFNHATRGHIPEDLHRYLFAACFAGENEYSPSLKDFPGDLLPNHQNVRKALSGSLFADRFRVQVAERPSTTITSHISKDGHYYIHPDPSQCRSLTVREAARLQTFPG